MQEPRRQSVLGRGGGQGTPLHCNTALKRVAVPCRATSRSDPAEERGKQTPPAQPTAGTNEQLHRPLVPPRRQEGEIQERKRLQEPPGTPHTPLVATSAQSVPVEEGMWTPTRPRARGSRWEVSARPRPASGQGQAAGAAPQSGHRRRFWEPSRQAQTGSRGEIAAAPKPQAELLHLGHSPSNAERSKNLSWTRIPKRELPPLRKGHQCCCRHCGVQGGPHSPRLHLPFPLHCTSENNSPGGETSEPQGWHSP